MEKACSKKTNQKIDLRKLIMVEVSKLYVSEIIKNQATTNIGTAGSVSHGKSTLIYCLTGTKTQKFKQEQIRNITVKLGYSGAKIFYDSETGKTITVPSKLAKGKDTYFDEASGKNMVLTRHVSFVDCPGHDAYMSTMITGSTIMDHVFFVIAANESVPQPQTFEHLLALKHADIKDYLVIHNKMDLLRKHDVLEHKKELDDFLYGSPASDSQIIPISAESHQNIDKICNYLQSSPPCRNIDTSITKMIIVRSFNQNRPNTKISELKGAVVGGTIMSGVISIGDLIEIRPGVIIGDTIRPLYSKVTSLECDGVELEYAVPGGLIAVGLELDAGLSSSDRLEGFQLGHIGSMSEVANSVSGKFKKIKKPGAKNTSLMKGEIIQLVSNGAMTVKGTVTMYKKKKISIQLTYPICVDLNDKIVIMKSTDESSWELHGTIDVDNFDLSLTFDKSNEPEMPLYKTYKIINDLVEIEKYNFPPYEEMLSGVSLRDNDYHPPSIKLYDPVISYHTIYTHFHNAVISSNESKCYLDCINLRPKTKDNVTDSKAIDLKLLICDFFKKELSATVSFNGENHMIISGRHNPNKIKLAMKKLPDKYFRCKSCDSISCYIEKTPTGSLYRKVCTNCPTQTNISSL